MSVLLGRSDGQRVPLTEKTDRSAAGLRNSIAVLAGAGFVALSVLMGFGVWSVSTLGGVREGLALLGGVHLYLPQPILELGEILPGRLVTIEIPLQNLSGSTLTVLGAKTDCSCVVTSGLPLTMPPRAKDKIEVHLTPTLRDAGTEIERYIEIYSDRSSESLWVVLKGTVAKPVAASPP